MSGADDAIETYIASAASGFDAIAESLLGASPEPLSDGQSLSATNRFTAFVPVLTDDETIYVGIDSSLDGAMRATRSFLGFEPGEADPSDDDVADAVGELANMTAGAVQRDLPGEKSELGLPVSVRHGPGLVLAPHLVREVAVADTLIAITVAPGPLRLDSTNSQADAA